MDRDSDGACLIGNRARDALPNPPGGIGGELEPPAVFELVHRLHQANIAFLNHIKELQAPVAVSLRNRDDEAEVRLDKMRFRLLGLGLAMHDLLVGPPHLRRRLAECPGKVVELGLELPQASECARARCSPQTCPLGCRMTLAFDRVDLTLGLLDGGGGGLEAVDESPLDRVGELDSTNQL